MAINTKIMFFNLVLVVSALLLISMAEGRVVDLVSAKGQSAPKCQTVFAVEADDTCFDVAQKFGLTAEFFTGINPNLNCNALFVGQWLCIEETF
ncbi:hypothetical protein GIB67_035957 [Kingdonia uniflora]|uniref:LysM domain-containing protein n=1 Tax=Kingdonia uniflora TaxID=39325 RepID=A0A7J7N0U6_9MAGN|nr:hypothetical protein GIB67_035957 [Kingdonia uniflora]